MPVDPDDAWPLVLRTGFGHVHRVGRWDYLGVQLLAVALASDEESDWQLVVAWSEAAGWDGSLAC